MTAPPRTSRGRRTVDRILDAACDLFAAQGLRATTLDQVGERSGTGRSQLYHYFDGKADLVAAVVARQVDRLMEDAAGAPATAAELRAVGGRIADSHRVSGVVRCPLGSLVHELGEDDVAARQALAAGFERWRARLAGGLRTVQARGELAPGADPDAVAAALLAAYQGGLVLAGPTSDFEPLRTALTAVAAGALAV